MQRTFAKDDVAYLELERARVPVVESKHLRETRRGCFLRGMGNARGREVVSVEAREDALPSPTPFANSGSAAKRDAAQGASPSQVSLREVPHVVGSGVARDQ